MGAIGSTCHLLQALEGCFLDRDLKSQVLLKTAKANASWGIYGHATQDSRWQDRVSEPNCEAASAENFFYPWLFTSFRTSLLAPKMYFLFLCGVDYIGNWSWWWIPFMPIQPTTFISAGGRRRVSWEFCSQPSIQADLMMSRDSWNVIGNQFCFFVFHWNNYN